MKNIAKNLMFEITRLKNETATSVRYGLMYMSICLCSRYHGKIGTLKMLIKLSLIKRKICVVDLTRIEEAKNIRFTYSQCYTE